MSAFQLKHLLAGAAMLAAAAGAVALKPTVHMADQHPINLEQMIPQQFGDWNLDKTIVPVQVDPEIQAKLDRIYSQMLSRTYVNQHGERVMLSIAYGTDQSDALKVHRPEVCYPSQGFEILRQEKTYWPVEGMNIPVTRLFSQSGSRSEPLMYWVTVGNLAVETGVKQKLAQLKYGLHRIVPDGLLFRVSTINGDFEAGTHLNEQFARQLLQSVSSDSKTKLGIN